MKKSLLIIYCLLLALPMIVLGQAAMTVDDLHGDENYSFRNWHSGNMIRTTFYNEGYVGRRETNPEDLGEWPINSGHSYINLITYYVGGEVRNAQGERLVIVSEANGTQTGDDALTASGDTGENGRWQTMTPLPGFADPDEQKIAMSHQEESWPASWPDKYDDTVDPFWPGSWNGYFGKDVLNADQESYYLYDDYNNDEFPYYPDSTDTDRRGLGLRGTVRGFQWSNVLVEDILFQLVDIKNISTKDLPKLNFGVVSGPVIGRSENSSASEGADDGAEFDLVEDIGWHFDGDDIGAGGWTPVGFHGFAYFESPGNPYDGIDNDDDAVNGSGPVITTDMFAPSTIQEGDEVIVIDYDTFTRETMAMPAGGITVTYLGNPYHFNAGDVFEEIPNNLIDDNLNGIIDENNGSVFGDNPPVYLYEGRKYVDFATGEGLDNILIDEERDDFIDNDGDWDILSDDVGLDGVPNTGDKGEGDGKPTSGAGTELPGEPHIDKTDIDESDMIGLTAFNIFSWGEYPFSDDDGLWEAIVPGYLNAYAELSDTDLILGSGYFPMRQQQIERFSLGIMFGTTKDDLFTNKFYANKTYQENYNFAKAPIIPTLTAIPGDNKVTLVWDDAAEFSEDPITGMDFEGYRIYRSTDPGFTDMEAITDGMGSIAYRKPLEQFDLINGLTGYAGIHVRGVEFYLGDDTGIVNTFVDTTARNGQLYYYAVTSYDHGGLDLGIAPSECSKYISIARDGSIEDKGRNVQAVRPEAPSNGFVEADLDGLTLVEGGKATGIVAFEIADPTQILDEMTYQLSFEDTIIQLDDKTYSYATKNFTLQQKGGEILIDKSTNLDSGAVQSLTDGFALQLFNYSSVAVNTDSTMWIVDSTAFTPDSLGRMTHDFVLSTFKYSRTYGVAKPIDFRIDFYDQVGVDTSSYAELSSSRKLRETPVNFTVTNLETGEPIAFAFYERDEVDDQAGKFTAFTDRTRSDQIILMDSTLINIDGEDVWHDFTYLLEFSSETNDSLHRNPVGGESIVVKTNKPFLSNDVYEFQSSARRTDDALVDLDAIRVVPNPYVVANSWEPKNRYSTGRGPRELHFTHLPMQCTIKIFNVRGQLVREIEHEGAIDNGTYIWDMQTKDLLDIAYGVYIYHIDAGDYGQKIGKFAVIK